MTVHPTDPEPEVSIVVPARNEASCIRRCLESLLAQDYPNIAGILVFDGASEDGTRSVVEDTGKHHPVVRLHDSPARVQTVAFNKGLHMAQCEIVVRADGCT